MENLFDENEEKPNKKIKAKEQVVEDKPKSEEVEEARVPDDTPVIVSNARFKARVLDEVPSVVKPTLNSFSTQELLDELYSRAHDERVNLLVDKAQRNLFDLKHGAIDDKIKTAFEKVYRQEIEGNIRAAKSLVK